MTSRMRDDGATTGPEPRSLRLRRSFGWSALLFAAVGVLAGCGEEESTPTGSGRTYYFVTHAVPDNPFWGPVRRGMSDAAKRYGVKAVFTGPTDVQDASRIPPLMDEAIAAKADGIAVTITDVDVVRDSVNKAAKAGIPVIAINLEENVEDGEPRTIDYGHYVGQLEIEAGFASAQRAMQIAAQSGKKLHRAVCLKADPALWADQRCDGVKAALPNDIVYTELQFELFSHPEKDADGPYKDFLAEATNGDLDFVMSTATPTLSLALRHPKEGAIIGSFDMDAETLDAVQSGTAHFTVDQQPYLQGYLPIVHFELFHDYLLAPYGSVATGPFLVDKSNVARIKSLVAEGIR
jgi:simple sugar transport system substrate-binding protein